MCVYLYFNWDEGKLVFGGGEFFCICILDKYFLLDILYIVKICVFSYVLWVNVIVMWNYV